MFIGDRSPPQFDSDRAAAAFDSAVEALSRADWRRACGLFQDVIAELPDSAEAWEGLAEAAWWTLDEPLIFEPRERAHQLHRARGDHLSAGRMAAWLAMDYIELAGQQAVSSGWLQRAYRLLEGRHSTEEYGWLLLFHARICMISGEDIQGARRLASRASSLAKRLGSSDLSALSLSLEGLAKLATSDVRRGVACLDESAACVMAGEVRNLTTEALTLCQLMAACERIKDFDRASQWCERAKQVSEARTFPALLALCRPHYASVLIWHGRWDEAEGQLQAAARELMEAMPPYVAEATLRLATLRLRQGRWDEAEDLLSHVEQPAAHLGMAELSAVRGDLETAVDLLERYIRQVAQADTLEHAAALDLLARYQAELGRFREAADSTRQLREIAESVGTVPLRASSAYAEGVLAGLRGDLEVAQQCLEDAVDFFQRGGAPFESARARIALAEVLARRHRRDAAVREATAARETMLDVGARKESERAERLLERIRDETQVRAAKNDSGLTDREMEVLQLLSSGRSNQEIAADLVLSVRTVERHISNIYQKLGLQGRTARTSAAAHAHRLSLGNR